MSVPLNRVKMTVTGAPGTGAFTLNAALSAFQSLNAAGGINTGEYTYLATEGNSWELGPGIYTSVGTILARCNPADPTFMSSSGVAINFTAAAIVEIILSAADILSLGGGLTPGTFTNATVTVDGDGNISDVDSGSSGGVLLGAPWTVPLVSDFTTFNLSTDVWTDSPAGINVNTDNNALSLRGGYKASPGGAFSIYLRTQPIFIGPAGNSRYAGILLQNSTTGRSLTYGHYTNGAAFALISCSWTNTFAFNGQSAQSQQGTLPPSWTRITIGALGVTDFSYGDGYTWKSTGITDLFATYINVGGGTVDRIGIAGSCDIDSMFVHNSFSTTAPTAGGGGQL